MAGTTSRALVHPGLLGGAPCTLLHAVRGHRDLPTGGHERSIASHLRQRWESTTRWSSNRRSRAPALHRVAACYGAVKSAGRMQRSLAEAVRLASGLRAGSEGVRSSCGHDHQRSHLHHLHGHCHHRSHRDALAARDGRRRRVGCAGTPPSRARSPPHSTRRMRLRNRRRDRCRGIPSTARRLLLEQDANRQAAGGEQRRSRRGAGGRLRRDGGGEWGRGAAGGAGDGHRSGRDLRRDGGGEWRSRCARRCRRWTPVWA